MRIDFVGDVITQPFSVLSKALGLVSVSVGHYPIDQHFQVLMSGSLSDILVCHARAEFFIGNGSGGDPLAKMHDYCAAVEQVAATRKTVIVLNTLLPQPNRLVGVHHLSYLRQVAQLNQAIFDLAHRQSLVTIADLAGVLARAGTDQALNVQNDMTMRMPYKRHVLPYLVAEYARAIRERFAPRKKVLLLDADNTLWGGIVGEDGVDGLAIDGQYPGSVYRQFQEQLVGLGESGVLLALVTKNNENDAREAFERLAMPLRWDSFSAVRANWFPKSENIASIAWELNVGLDSMVFIDDNLFEIEEVRNAHPMIDCYHFDGRNAREALQLLYTITDLGIWAPTAEDSGKRAQYAQERERQELHTSAASIDDYIKSLGIRIEAGINRTRILRVLRSSRIRQISSTSPPVAIVRQTSAQPWKPARFSIFALSTGLATWVLSVSPLCRMTRLRLF
jgi:HAD superfamily phosphatase (TIGR01681 family)